MESEISTEKLIGLFRALAAILIQGLSACQLVQDFIAKYGLTEEERKEIDELNRQSFSPQLAKVYV